MPRGLAFFIILIVLIAAALYFLSSSAGEVPQQPVEFEVNVPADAR